MMRTLALLFTTLTAWSHDMWIEPATFAPQPGSIVAVKLRVGQDLIGDPIPRSAALIREFIAAGAAGRKLVVGREGSDPAGFVLQPPTGGTVVGYHSHPSPVELDAAKFNAYVQEEGVRGVAARGPKVRERFTRCAKSLLGATDQVLGFPLELVAEAPGTYRLIYQNRPLPGTLVVAFRKGHPEEKLSARTAADGRVRLPLAGEGMWLVKAVHIVPDGEDWQSYWASLTFSKGDR